MRLFLWTIAVAGSQIYSQEQREKTAPSSPLSFRLQSPVRTSLWRGNFWPPVSLSLGSVSITPQLSSPQLELRFQPHICVLLQDSGTVCCLGNLRTRKAADSADWSAILIHTPRQLDWSKTDHVWEGESCRESALLSSRWCNVSGKQDGQRTPKHPLSVTRTGDGEYSHKREKNQNRGRKEQADGEEEVLKTGRGTALSGRE